MTYYSYMVDIETTGTRPDHAGIIQLAAVRFNLKTREIDTTTMFDRCLQLPPKRFWDEDTRHWWYSRNRETLQGIQARQEDPRTVLQDFANWVNSDNDMQEPLRFWAKPTTFDYSFLQSYFYQFELNFPFHFRHAVDLNSFIRGMAGDENAELTYAEFQGTAHNALVDTINQIGNLFAAMDHYGQTK